MYDLCVFDLDGTLSDPQLGLTRSYQHALAAFGIYEEAKDLTRFIGPPLRDNFRGYYGFSESDTEKAVTIFREYFDKKGLIENTLYPDIPETLQKLKDLGKTLAVATTKVKSFTDIIIDYFSLGKYFDFVSGDELDGSLTKNGKRDIIRIVMDTLDPKREMNTVMIGDRLYDIIGARDNGIDSIGVLWGFGSRAELEDAGATRIIASVGELIQVLSG